MTPGIISRTMESGKKHFVNLRARGTVACPNFSQFGSNIIVNEDCDRHSTVGFYIARHIPQHVIMHNFHKASLIGIMYYLLNNFRVSMSYDNGASGYGGAANGKFYFSFSKALDCQNDMS